jgi:hypothetical protein
MIYESEIPILQAEMEKAWLTNPRQSRLIVKHEPTFTVVKREVNTNEKPVNYLDYRNRWINACW